PWARRRKPPRAGKPGLNRRFAKDAHTTSDTANLEALAEELDQIIASENPRRPKSSSPLVKEIGPRPPPDHPSQIPTAVRAIPRKVEAAGIEPASADAPTGHLQA